MRFTQLATRTTKIAASSDVSRNAQLLTRAGYVDRLMAGVYSFLPLGLRVLGKIENIIRDEMNAMGGQEILMPALQPRELWETTGRWDKMDVLFKLKGAGDRDLTLGPTHEEVVTPLIGRFIQSYRDLPKAVYQIQTKFRNEARAKSGLLRGREFRMKDLYSFHATQADLDAFYEKAIVAYRNIFRRCGLGDITLLTFASGGAFSKYSHEFQTITPYGEDTVYKLPATDLAINKEIIADEAALSELIPGYQPGQKLELEEAKAIEIGNIFKLGSKYSDPFNLSYTDAAGQSQSLCMGCYGIGPSRVMGTIAEVLSDENGLIWPPEVAPYDVHLVSLFMNANEQQEVESLYNWLGEQNIAVLWDDRLDVRAGEKFADADLLGVPHRIVISKKTLGKGAVEHKRRTSDIVSMIPQDRLLEELEKL